MTRLLQHWFHEDRTFFLVVLRHPFASIRFLWERVRRVKFCSDCGEKPLIHWLHIHDTLFEDLTHIKHRLAFHFERFALGDTQGFKFNSMQ